MRGSQNKSGMKKNPELPALSASEKDKGGRKQPSPRGHSATRGQTHGVLCRPLPYELLARDRGSHPVLSRRCWSSDCPPWPGHHWGRLREVSTFGGRLWSHTKTPGFPMGPVWPVPIRGQACDPLGSKSPAWISSVQHAFGHHSVPSASTRPLVPATAGSPCCRYCPGSAPLGPAPPQLLVAAPPYWSGPCAGWSGNPWAGKGVCPLPSRAWAGGGLGAQ